MESTNTNVRKFNYRYEVLLLNNLLFCSKTAIKLNIYIKITLQVSEEFMNSYTSLWHSGTIKRNKEFFFAKGWILYLKKYECKCFLF